MSTNALDDIPFSPTNNMENAQEDEKLMIKPSDLDDEKSILDRNLTAHRIESDKLIGLKTPFSLPPIAYRTPLGGGQVYIPGESSSENISTSDLNAQDPVKYQHNYSKSISSKARGAETPTGEKDINPNLNINLENPFENSTPLSNRRKPVEKISILRNNDGSIKSPKMGAKPTVIIVSDSNDSMNSPRTYENMRARKNDSETSVKNREKELSVLLANIEKEEEDMEEAQKNRPKDRRKSRFSLLRKRNSKSNGGGSGVMTLFRRTQSEGLATIKAQEVIRDKSSGEKAMMEKLSRGNTKNKIPKLRIILGKYAAVTSTAEDHTKLFNVLAQLRKMNMGTMDKLKAWLKEMYTNLSNKIQFRRLVKKYLLRALDPDGYFKWNWNLIIVLFITTDLLFLPFTMAFRDVITQLEANFDVLDAVQNVVFFIDIFLNFHTAYDEDGILTYKHSKITRHYLQNWFWLDFISIFPFNWIGDYVIKHATTENEVYAGQVLLIFKFIRVFRMVRIQRFFQKVHDYIYNKMLFSGIINLIKLTMIIIFLAHWCACGWRYIAIKEEGGGWIKGVPLAEATLTDQYVSALYFALTTMLTLGYGDIVPVTSSERIYTIFMMLLGGGVFGYAMNSIAMILQSLENEKSKFRKKVLSISKHLQKKGLNKDVQLEVKKYLHFVFEDNHNMNHNDKEMFGMLSQDLKDKIYEQMNGRLLYENKVLLKNFTKKVLYDISKKIEEKTYVPGEKIYDPMDTSNCLYFVVKGKLEVFLPKCEDPWFYLKKGGQFGEYSFFTGRSRICSIRNVDFSHVWY